MKDKLNQMYFLTGTIRTKPLTRTKISIIEHVCEFQDACFTLLESNTLVKKAVFRCHQHNNTNDLEQNAPRLQEGRDEEIMK